MSRLTEKILASQKKNVDGARLKEMVVKRLPGEVDALWEGKRVSDKGFDALFEGLAALDKNKYPDAGKKAAEVLQRQVQLPTLIALETLSTVSLAGFFDKCPEMKSLAMAIAGNSLIWTEGLKRIIYSGEGLEAIGTNPFNNQLTETFLRNYGRVEGMPHASLVESILTEKPLSREELFVCSGWAREHKDAFDDSLNYYKAIGLMSIKDDGSVESSPEVGKAFERYDRSTFDSGQIPYDVPMFNANLSLKIRLPNVPLKPYWDKKFNG